MPRRQKITNEDLKAMRQTVTLLQGSFEESFFDILETRKPEKVFVCEGRPSLANAKATCKELLKRDITPVLISDNMAGFLFYKNLVKEVWLAYAVADKRGALCHIGACILGVLSKKHGIPVYCYPSVKKAELMGKEKDIFSFMNKRLAPKGIKGYVPLMEWVPGPCFWEKKEQSEHQKT